MTVEYHELDGQYDALPALMVDLVRRRVAVIETPALPHAARAQEAERVRRIDVLGLLAEGDPDATAPEAALHETLAGLAWSEGPNVRIDLFLQ